MGTEWITVKLAKLMRPAADPYSVDASRSYRNLGIYSFGRGVFSKPPIEGTTTSASTLYRVRSGQFIYSRLFAFEGAYAIVPQNFDGCYVSNEFPTFECDLTRLEPRFLAWLFKRPSIWRAIASRSTGMGDRRQRIHPEQVLEQVIPLPQLDEQRRIVARIETLATKVEEARELRANNTEATDALATSAAAQSLDVLTNASTRLPLGSLVTVRGGGTPSKDAPRFWGGEIPWITPKDMKRRVLTDAIDHITALAVKETPAKLIEPGAVLTVVRGMILAHTFPAAVLMSPAAINQDMKALIPDKRVLPEYLCAVLWARNARVLELVERSGHDTRKLNTGKLLAFEIPVPAIQLQRRVIAELDALQSKVDSVKTFQTEIAAELDVMIPAILDRAFNGKL